MVENALGQFLVTSITKRTPLQPEMQAEAAQDANKKTKHAVEFQVACLTNSASHSCLHVYIGALPRALAVVACNNNARQSVSPSHASYRT